MHVDYQFTIQITGVYIYPLKDILHKPMPTPLYDRCIDAFIFVDAYDIRKKRHIEQHIVWLNGLVVSALGIRARGDPG